MRVAVLSSGRQDWGILRSTCALLRDADDFELRLVLGGMHCSARFGHTLRGVEADGFRPAEALGWIDDARAPDAIEEMAKATSEIGHALERQAPDALLLVGDRFETAAAALSATIARVPIVHLHGGEETAGAFDNALRHAITKLSHLHLVSHPTHARRVVALGEDPSTVHVVGAPGLDNLHRDDIAGRAELEQYLGIELKPPVVLVTLHPTTLAEDVTAECDALVEAMDALDATYVVTLPNSDPGHTSVRERLLAACARVPRRRVAVDALGERRFWGMLRHADAIAGNSSSALIEAPIMKLPAVNIGDRQGGRERGANVIDAEATAGAVTSALRRALDPRTRAALADCQSPFGDGRSAPRILSILRNWRAPKPPFKAPVPC